MPSMPWSRVEEARIDGPTPAMRLAFDRVIRFELLFSIALGTGETW